jgi:hypothetical protein
MAISVFTRLTVSRRDEVVEMRLNRVWSQAFRVPGRIYSLPLPATPDVRELGQLV